MDKVPKKEVEGLLEKGFTPERVVEYYRANGFSEDSIQNIIKYYETIRFNSLFSL